MHNQARLDRIATNKRSTGFQICAASFTLLLASCSPTPEEANDPSRAAPPNPATTNQQQVIPAGSQTLSVGVVPQQSASTLAKQWIPLLNDISKRANVRLVFKTAPDIPTFEKRCSAGEYDIAYMNPYHYTVFHEQPGYEAIAKRSDSKIKGIIVKKIDSDIKSLTDLNGKNIAFPAPRSFAATLLTTAGLRAAGVQFESKFVSSHDSVYLNVSLGTADAGCGIMRTYKSISPDIRKQLEILWETPSYTPHAFAIHPRVAPNLKAAVTKAMIETGRNENGRDLLAPLKIKNLEAASNQDWDDVRDLKITIR